MRFAPINAIGDLIMTIYLYALARFFFALSGIDSGSRSVSEAVGPRRVDQR
jgi:formate hydrogenlyase subunit 4